MRCTTLTLPIVFLLLALTSTALATATTSSTCYFGNPALGTYINFENTQTLTTAYRQGDYWFFDSYRFQVQNANLTINKYFQNLQLIFTVSAGSGVDSTTHIYIPGKSSPNNVTGATTWSFDWATSILTVNVHHASSQQIVASWTQAGWSMDINALVMWFWLAIGLFGLIPVGFATSIAIGAIRGKELPLQKILPLFIPTIILVYMAIIVLQGLLGVF